MCSVSCTFHMPPSAVQVGSLNRSGDVEEAKESADKAFRWAGVSYAVGVLFWAIIAFMVSFTLFYLFFYYVVDSKLH